MARAMLHEAFDGRRKHEKGGNTPAFLFVTHTGNRFRAAWAAINLTVKYRPRVERQRQSRVNNCPFDRGREGLTPSPPSEPHVRFSRIRLSSRWFPHRDWLADCQALVMVKSPAAAKNLLGQRRWSL